ncbi:MAG: sulfotransferase, partial [Anaerolineales bacterium]|nr:sulfotransferase [Anaerolineales bacterium]
RNPRGYYEIQAAMELGKEGQPTDWVADARGKAVKVIAYQLRHLPPEFSYRVIFMRRRIAEILASSGEFKMLREDSPLSEREKILAYKTEYVMYEAWLMKQKHLPALVVNYNDLIDNPAAPVARVRDFLGVPLDADQMLAAIDPALYRNRAQG